MQSTRRLEIVHGITGTPSKVDKKCNEGAYVRSIVISGSVANGQEATWDLQKMVENYPAC
ncbi:MAG: hypothetical protein QXL44_07220 [Candidatus Nitrosocaldus sp.]